VGNNSLKNGVITLKRGAVRVWTQQKLFFISAYPSDGGGCEDRCAIFAQLNNVKTDRERP
jgi:hypothetical protein